VSSNPTWKSRRSVSAGTSASSVAAESPAPVEIRPAYANYVLAVFFFAYVVNFVDRQILAILLDPIKEDLGVSDTFMGFLTGTAFALFYATAGIPIARWADRSVRRSVVAIGMTVWSAMTALSGMAQTATQIALARVGVGVGEAALSPPAHSILADYFPPERRATAMGIYSMGIHVGILFGLTAGGWLSDNVGWRQAFFVVGIPGLFLALLVRLTVREPVRGGTEPKAREAAAADETIPSAGEVLRHLWGLRSFRHLSFATGLTAFSGYAFASWGPTFLRRVHDMSGSEAGTSLGFAIGISGAIGSVLAGVLADRLARRDVRFYMWVPAFAALAPLPFTLFFFFHGDPTLALMVAFPGLLFGAMYQGPIFSTVQTMAPLRMRSVASAILLFIINMIGLALGPQTVGVLNDTVFASYGNEAIRYSLASVSIVMGFWGFVHFLLAGRYVEADLRTAGEA
jgi:predicted MFS family arabinose efflux permease